MSTDPTDRLMQAMAAKAETIPPSKALTVCEAINPRPLDEETLMSEYDRSLFKLLANRMIWRLKTFKEVQRAMKIGQTIRPDFDWQFYHLDPIREIPERKLWIVAAHRRVFPRSEQYTLDVSF